MSGLRQNHEAILDTSHCDLGYIVSRYSLNGAVVLAKAWGECGKIDGSG